MKQLPDLAAFNGFDWFVLVVLAISVAISLWRGFSREALSLAGWVIAFILANVFATQLSAYLAGAIENTTGRYIVAWSCVFVIVLLLAGFAARVFARLVKASGLGLLDRLLGTVFGAARGLLIIMVLLFVVRSIVPPTEQDWLRDSQLLPHIDLLLDWSLRAFDNVSGGRLPSLAT